MPHIPKKKIIDLIENHLEVYQGLFDKRMIDIKQDIDEEVLYHALWTFCVELVDFKALGLITSDEFGHYIWRWEQIVKDKPEFKKQVNRALHMGYGTKVFPD